MDEGADDPFRRHFESWAGSPKRVGRDSCDPMRLGQPSLLRLALHRRPLHVTPTWFLPNVSLFPSCTAFFEDSLGFIAVDRVLLGFTEFYLVFMGSFRFCLGLPHFYWVFLGFTWFRWVSRGFNRFYWVLLGFHGFL